MIRRTRRTKSVLLILSAFTAGLLLGSALPALAVEAAPRQAEKLDRGVVAVPAPEGVLVSWRLLVSDDPGIGFNLYRDGRKLNAAVLKAGTNFLDREGGQDSRYEVRPVLNGREQAEGRGQATVWTQGYLSIPLQQPEGGTTPAGESYSYTANDASVGDLNGDGRYEIILKWDPTNSKDNAFAGYTGPVIFDAYTLDGERLWRIDMGRNIRAGAHYTQFLVYDFDGDGRAEFVAKTGDGTIDGTGTVLGDAGADWRGGEGEVPQADRTGAVTKPDGRKVAPLTGRILKGPEYLTVFDGLTGKALGSVDFSPARHPETATPTTEQLTALWGDGYGNRSDRFLAGVAYLDGQHPSIIMARGYYARTAITAWDWREGRLSQRWQFDSRTPGNEDFGGQGNHQLAIADVDGDGRDEIVYGSMAVDNDGTGLWTAKLLHGDALHVSDLDPTRPGLERFGVHESPGRNGGIGAAMLDARTGAILWSTPAEKDVGRGLAADIDPRAPGAEAWGSNSPLLYDARGSVIAAKRPKQTNFAVWWDGDLLRELLDGNEITKWDWSQGQTRLLLKAEGAVSNNSTKSNPALSADLIGDWREEVIWRAEDNRSLRIYSTPIPSEHRLVTLMQDPVYRLSVAWQNVAYNQPPHPGFYLGVGMETPPRQAPR